jgi:sialic acid synthase
MAGKEELNQALDVITKFHSSISILHCVSQYPTEPQNLNLRTITYLKKQYPQYKIGFSDHTIGIAAATAAVAMGAEIVEKHITIDRKMKGTDQAGSLGPDGVNRMIRDIRLAELWMGKEDLFIDPSVIPAKNKLERSVATKANIEAGETITLEKLHLLSPGDGIKWVNVVSILGKKAKHSIPANTLIRNDDIE